MKPLRVFIIQPFKKDYSTTFRDLVADVCKSDRFEGGFDPFHAIEEPSFEPRLQDRINDYLKRADICVADLSTPRNDNALLEVGAAYTLGIPVIPFSDKELPADIRGNRYIKMELNGIEENEDLQEEFKRQLRRKLLEARSEIGSTKALRYLSHAFQDRGALDFYSMIERCEQRLNILTTNLNYVVNEDLYCGPDVGELTFLQIVASAMPKKASRFTLRILALDPDSNFTNERALSLGRDRQEFREQMRADLDLTKEFIESEDCGVSAEIKLYNDYPLQMTFFFDDTLVSSVVATSLSSRHCVTYMHSLRELGARKSYEQHFDHLWGKSEQYAVSQRKKKRERSWKKPDRT